MYSKIKSIKAIRCKSAIKTLKEKLESSIRTTEDKTWIKFILCNMSFKLLLGWLTCLFIESVLK